MLVTYFQTLSKQQRIIGIVGLCAILVIVVTGIVIQPGAEKTAPPEIGVEMTISEAAHVLGLKGGDLAVELGFPREMAKNVPMTELGIDDAELSRTVTHLRGHTDSTLKYFLFAALVLWGWIFLVMIGRPENAPPEEKKAWYPRLGYVIALMLAVIKKLADKEKLVLGD
jgi:hypothetical protein